MIGLIEKVIVDCLLDAGGDELRQDVFFAAGIPSDREYRMDVHYPDSETARLIEASLQVTDLTPDAFFDLFAVQFFDLIEQIFPEFLSMCDSSEDLVRRQIKIHAIMAAGCRDPEETKHVTDKFQLVDHGPHDIEVHYKSGLRLYGLYETLLHHAAERFGDTVTLRTEQHVPEGSDTDICVFSIKWTSINGQPTRFHETVEDSALKGRAHG